jgi:hypothetical protein
MIKILNTQLYKNQTRDKPLNWVRLPRDSDEMVELFDQNGYRLTKLEQAYSTVNEQLYVSHRDEKSIRKPWMSYQIKTTGPHLNHAFLFERKGYSGEALKELKEFAKDNNLLYKLISYKGKWGVDFSMDYVDKEGNAMELVHFEYDSYNLSEVQEIKERVEEAMVIVDWDFAAQLILEKKHEWIDLDFFEQSKWKTDFFGLPAERFKMNAWE